VYLSKIESQTMTTPSPSPRRSVIKRNAILDAATLAFRDHGFENANLDDISDAAGVSKRTLYKQFGSKEQLFQVVIQQLLGKLAELRSDKPLSSKPLAGQLLGFAESKVAAMADDQSWNALMRIVLSVIVQNPAMARKTLRALQKDDEWLCAWFQAAHDSGRLRVPHPDQAARLFWGLMWGAVLWPRVIGMPMERNAERDLIKGVVELFMHRYEN
jgi:TetR/AcrR family transcriptional regulator, regulator of autoinduction and epiphytic fitness